MSKTKKILIGIILLTVVLLGIGYAAIQNVTLNIAGTATADPSQSNFIVRFTGTPEVSDSTKATAAITDDTNATINVEGLTASGETVTATYTVQNVSTDLSADLTVEATNSNEEYFVIDADLAKTSIEAGETTILTVTVELIKTPISTTETATIEIELTATPVQPGQEGTTSGGINQGGEVKTTLASATNDNIGEYIDLGNNIVGTDSTIDDWRILYVDGDTVYVILADYLPNSTGYAKNAGLGISGTYNVYLDQDPNTFVTVLTTESNWTGLANGIDGAMAIGSPTLEIAGYSYSQTSGISTEELLSNIIGGEEAYQLDKSIKNYDLYVPKNSVVEECSGFWISSLYNDSYVMCVECDGSCVAWVPGHVGLGLRPVVALPASTDVVKNGNTWIISVNNEMPSGESNEYGFYYGVPYSMTQGEDKMSYVFFEDGSGILYENEVLLQRLPAGTFVYEEKKIYKNGNPVQVSDDGSEISNESFFAVAELGVTVAKCGIWGHSESDGFNHTVVADCTSGHYDCQQSCGSLEVPEGGTYTMASAVDGDKTVYNAGESLPECYESQAGDILVCGDYEYRYNQYFDVNKNDWIQMGDSVWGVIATDNTKTQYGEIYSNINGKDVGFLIATFYNCTAMTESPTIPDGVKNMTYAFSGCSSLVTAPKIPNGVEYMEFAFYGCTSMVSPPEIPDGVKWMLGTFSHCTALRTAPVLPSNNSCLNQTFYRCESLIAAPEIPDGVTDMSLAFQGCTSLTTVPEIPSSVTDMASTFENCTSLIAAPTIPSSVNILFNTFKNCTSLTGIVQINTDKILNNDSYRYTENNGYNCFYGTEKTIVLKGTGTNNATLELLAGTANNGNVTVE